MIPLLAMQETLPPQLEAARGAVLASPEYVAAAVALGAAALAYGWLLYRRDAAEIRPGYAFGLFGLRLGVLVALGLYAVQFQQRSDRQETFDSRVAVLVDTSLSMARTDADLTETAGAPRWRQVANELDAHLIDRLRAVHQVYIYTFDQAPKPALVAVLDKRNDQPAAGDAAASDSASIALPPVAVSVRDYLGALPAELRWLFAGVLAASVVLAVCWLARPIAQRRVPIVDWPWALLGTIAPVLPIVAMLALAYHDAQSQESFIAEREPSAPAATAPNQPAPTLPAPTPPSTAALADKLRPHGAATRLGDALAQILVEQRANPLAGIVVFTDGGQNAGENPQTLLANSNPSSVPIYTVGIGSARVRSSVRIADFAAPSRVFPDDRFDVTTTVQATNMKDRTIAVSLYSRSGEGPAAAEKLEATERVRLGDDGQLRSVKFVLPPAAIGRHIYVARLEKLADDDDLKDNEAQGAVDVAAQQMRVLLFASGPARDYQYVRNLFHRDKTISVDVLLQTAPPGPGISQDADAILAEFPRAKADLDKYDAIIGFDPDWTALDSAQVDLLADWVNRRLGGLIVTAGPIHTIRLASDTKSAALAKIRELYPVLFARRGLALASDVEKFRSTTPWHVELTRDGLEAPFLRLADDAAASTAAWEEFSGVFGYFPVSGAKAGARVYAHYATPDAAKAPPVYLAGQFYGAGRVFYLGSAETWRMRAFDEAYLERLWTKLVRFVAEGRLLRGTRRGAILLDNRKASLGDRVEVRAMLQTADHDPLVVDRVTIENQQPDGAVGRIILMPDANTPGVYRGDFQAQQQGAYRLELQVPGSPPELASETLRVLEPDLEADHSRRDDALLSGIAAATGAKYYIGAATTRGIGAAPLAAELRDVTRHLRVRGAPSAAWDRHWATLLLALICGLLFVEWTLRRVAKLA
jgi:hypothetical protein